MVVATQQMATCLALKNVTYDVVLVQELWEFGAKGKQQVLVRGALPGEIEEMCV